MLRNFRYGGAVVLVLTAGVLCAGAEGPGTEDRAGPPQVPAYAAWRLEEEATTYRPGTDLQFYALELKTYANPADPSERVVELRRHDALYILYHYTFKRHGPRWEIYMDAGFADAPCGFFDPNGNAAGLFVRIDLACLRDAERIDRRSD
ncbi:MAG: hypothetical protein ACE5IQ_06880 [Candidatus Methylomirabilales bacterium]